jgi:hypothetical protein
MSVLSEIFAENPSFMRGRDLKTSRWKAYCQPNLI